MRGEIDWELLAKYVAGECSERERVQVRSWIREDPARAKRVERIQQIWTAADSSPPRWDVDSAWKEVQQRTQQDEHARVDRAAPPSSARRSRGARPRPRSNPRRLLRASAALFVVAVAVFLVLRLQEGGAAEPSEFGGKTFATQRGQQVTAHLPDGTEIRLNVDSRLVLSEGFASDRRREVYLEGRAYFEVASDTTRPFIVHTQDASVQVLGTAFDVQAYTREDAVQVAVAEGEVALRPVTLAGQDTAAVLQPYSVGAVVAQRLQPVQRGVDVSGQLAWMEGRLVFEDASFEEVIRRLERWYDLQIETRVPAHAVVGLNATFTDEPLSEVLYNIAVALNLKYEHEQGVVTFYR